MSVKRYSIESRIYSPETGPLLRSRLDVAEAEDGPWVKHEDHVAELARRVPNPDDLRAVLTWAPYRSPEAARVRATLEETE